MTTRPFLCFLLLIGRLTVQGQPLPDQMLAPEQLQADLTRFKMALHEVHPEQYRYTPKARFDSLFATIANRLNHPMTRQAFYVTMTPLLVALRDGHIKWLVPGQDEHYPFSTENLFSLKLKFSENRAWVVGNYSTQTIPAGSEILAINGQSMMTIIEQLLPNMTFADGTTTGAKYEDLNHFFSGYYATYIGAPTAFTVTYRTAGGEQTAQLPAISYKAINAYDETHKPVSQPPFRLAFIADRNQTSPVAVMTIERFSTDKNDPSYKTFLSESFREIRVKKVQNLILDLRNNEGGEESWGVLLYQYLAQKPFRYYDYISVHQKKSYSFPAWTSPLYRKLGWLFVKKRGDGYVFTKQRGLKSERPKPDAFAGKLYVLINGYSFSVTTEFAARVHADQRATFIGQETGGAYEGNSSGLFAVTQLPNSKLELGIPMFGFHMANLPENLQKGQGIRPDHVVAPTVDDVLTGNDRVMQYTQQLIRLGDSTPPKTTAKNQ